jgi:hypothetical protein
MVDIQQATLIDVAITVAAGRKKVQMDWIGVLAIAVLAAIIGGAAAYVALRGVARWCPTCGARLGCVDCNRYRTDRPSGTASGRPLNQGAHR